MIREFQTTDTPSVISVWEAAELLRPWIDPYEDISRKAEMNDGLFLIEEENEKVVGTVMGGYDGHRGWVYYLAVDPEYRGLGKGRQLMDAVEHRLRAAGCPKINLQIRTDNVDVMAFYRALGYRPDEVVSVGKRLQG